MEHKLNEEDMAAIFMNPYYAIDIHPSFFGEHKHMVTKEEWIKGNKLVIKEIGMDKWLRGLLDVLESGGV